MIAIPEYPNAAKVFAFFEEISKIPHGSTNTAMIADYLVRFARERGLFVLRDGADNVLIRKAAAKGCEDRPAVILQGHIDMVAEKTPDNPIDMKTEGLSVFRDGDFLRASGTTLGGDDGVAVAYALAILDDPEAKHPPLEALFTSDEEIGLIGATAFDTSLLQGKIMLNIDSDDEGVFTVGCAGGVRVDVDLPVERAEDAAGGRYLLTVSGLRGGHSGADIDKRRANANRIMAELLTMIGKVRAISFAGGNADNAIPRDCAAAFAADGEDALIRIAAAMDTVTKKYKRDEPDIAVTCAQSEADGAPLTEASTAAFLNLMNDEPNGVIAMSEQMPELVQTSLNCGIVRLEEKSAQITFALRSSKSAEKAALLARVTAIAEAAGATVTTRGDYPAWEYREDSHLREVCCEVYRELYGKDPVVMTIHAGLECGIFSDRIDGLDCISLGPDNFDIHTTEEHLSISSAARVYDYLKVVLEKI